MFAVQVYEAACFPTNTSVRLRPVDVKQKTPYRLMIGGLILCATGGSQSGLPVTYDRLLKAGQEPGNWLTYSGDYASHRFSSLAQINRENIQKLHTRWIFQEHHSKVEATPLVVDGIMYTVRVPNDVVAIDAETGRLLWTYVHKVPLGIISCCGQVNRGLAIEGNRLFMETLDGELLALDARSGRLLWKREIVDYTKGYAGTGAPLVVKDRVIVGIAGGEYGIRGFLDAYYIATGERAWRLYTIPAKGEPGNDTWAGDSWEHGGGSTWLTGSFDPDLNLIYWGTGKPRSRYEWRCPAGR